MIRNGYNILIVDDNVETLETLCMMARELKAAKVTPATSHDEALAHLREDNGINLILCDWNMPGKTGLDLLKELREEGNLIPFIMVTARKDIGSVLEARDNGVDLYISKPFSMVHGCGRIATR